jgi:hypothetical protein
VDDWLSDALEALTDEQQEQVRKSIQPLNEHDRDRVRESIGARRVHRDAGVDESPTVHRYITEVRRIPPLTRAEEVSLVAAARDGDEVAKSKAIQGNLELAAVLALRFAPAWLDAVKAIQEANLVLLRAVEDAGCVAPSIELAERIHLHFEQLGGGGPDTAGVREPRRPVPTAGAGNVQTDLDPDD